ncbi:MAG: hypothetical protein JW840_00210 [Candidatus Thermoplasmatota archaeon]|nr:hypothetical protein [Candidatus Thermoplasmatota archaeon]
MKKILLVVIFINMILSGPGSILAVSALTMHTQTVDTTVVLSVSFPAFDPEWMRSTSQGLSIMMPGYDHLTTPGDPALPVQHLLIALPPQASVLSLEGTGGDVVKIPGTYDIRSAPSPIPLDGTGCSYDALQTPPATSEPLLYPAEQVYLQSSGSFQQYPYVSVAVCPFQYSPVTGELWYSTEVVMTVHYQSNVPSGTRVPVRPSVSQTAASLFVNYEQIKAYYPVSTPSPIFSKELVDYLIITTDELMDAITASNFLAWKHAVGYSLQILSVTDPSITGQSGDDLAEKIRSYLRESYSELGLKYVLFVGDSEDVPMRYCYPNPANHQNTAGSVGGPGGEIPTDTYYADLSSADELSWDADLDGFYGEYGQDHPDFAAEVFVGRIPTSDPSRITYALNKIVTFEQDTGAWKHHALAPGAFFYFSNETGTNTGPMDGARVGAVIADDLMGNWTVSRYTEQEGLETSLYPGAVLTEEAWTLDWRTNQYALVNWAAHGWSDLIARKVWSSDDGDLIPEANEITWPRMLRTTSTLDDDYPSIVTAISCYVGYPEANSHGNLGIDLLTRPGFGAAVGVISSARSPYGNLDWPATLGGSDSIIYEFNNNLINRSMSMGDALFASKFFCTTHYGWTSYEEYIDLYTFNLFGDPSLVLEGKEGNIPYVQITKPGNGVFLFNRMILAWAKPLLIGAVDVEVSASDLESGIAYVQFLVDGEVLGNDSSAPYSWRWTQRSFGKHTLSVRAYNNTGSFAVDTLGVKKFF